ncbi:MAG: PAS domain S-box protein, partial [Calditrichaeota bacterium]
MTQIDQKSAVSRQVRIDLTELTAAHSVDNLLRFLRQAVVDVSEGALLAATYRFSEPAVQILSPQTLSKRDLDRIKSDMQGGLGDRATWGQESNYLAGEINGQLEEDYHFNTTAALKSGWAVQITVSGKPLGLLYLGELDTGKAAEGESLLRLFTQSFGELLKMLWELGQGEKLRYAALLAKSIDGIVMCDSEQKIRLLNRAAYRLLGLQEGGEFVGKPLDQLGREYLVRCVEEAEAQHLNEVNKVVTLQAGESRYLGVHTELLKDPAGREIGWMILLRDVTSNWQRDQMRSALTVASHEIKTPLNSISGAIDLLLEQDLGELNEKQHQCISIIKDDISRLNRLLSDILDLARIDEGVQFVNRRKQIALSYLVNKVVASFELLARTKNLQVHNCIPRKIPNFKGDRDRLQQVLANLLENAIKFSLPGGKIEIGAELKQSVLTCWVRDFG